MEHIGIDLRSKDSQVCVRDSTGAITEEARRSTAELDRWLASRVPARVVLETCTEAFRLAGVAQRHGHEVRVVAATLRQLAPSACGQLPAVLDNKMSSTLQSPPCLGAVLNCRFSTWSCHDSR
jgi:hypothetical protein